MDCIAGERNTAVFFVDNLYSAVLCSIAVLNFNAAVTAAVIHTDEFEICKILTEDAVEATGEPI